MSISVIVHIQMLLFVLTLILSIQYWGIHAKKSDKLPQTSRALGFSMIILWCIYNAYYFQPDVFAWQTSLPLQVCDIMALVSGIALVRPSRLGRSLLFFSALTLTTQAIITPTGNQDPSSARFWLYWLLHGGIIACSLFDIIIRNYKPSIKDFVLVVIADLTYVLIVLPLNIVYGWNYGYLGNSTPDGTTIIDLLGPWPERVAIIVGLAITLQAAMFVFWLAWQSIISKSLKNLRSC